MKPAAMVLDHSAAQDDLIASSWKTVMHILTVVSTRLSSGERTL
jgi:hypothetical protein